MLAIPAIDLRKGQVVNPGASSQRTERPRLGDPRAVARRWSAIGFPRLHVADLDAAAGRDPNHDAIRDLLFDAAAPMQVSGGIRTMEAAEGLLGDGAAWVVLSADALDEPDWLAEVADANPHSIIVAAEVCERRVVTPRSLQGLARGILDLVDDLGQDRPLLGGLLVRSTHRDGWSPTLDLALIEDIVEAVDWPLFVSGGIATLGELRALEERGVAGAVLGTALYAGTLDAWVVAGEFAN